MDGLLIGTAACGKCGSWSSELLMYPPTAKNYDKVKKALDKGGQYAAQRLINSQPDMKGNIEFENICISCEKYSL